MTLALVLACVVLGGLCLWYRRQAELAHDETAQQIHMQHYWRKEADWQEDQNKKLRVIIEKRAQE